jgi:hypothetical protein
MTDVPLNLPSFACFEDSPITKGDLAQALYPNTSYDCALPQSFVDNLYHRGYDRDLPGNSAFHFVWGYPESAPLPLTQEALTVLIKHGATI